LLESHLECLQRVERAEVLKAARSVARGKNFVEWLNTWYQEFRELVTGRIQSIVACYAGLSTADPGLPHQIAGDYCGEHVAELLRAADGETVGFTKRVQTVLNGWRKDCLVLVDWQIAQHKDTDHVA